jgi:hypothetical protein
MHLSCAPRVLRWIVRLMQSYEHSHHRRKSVILDPFWLILTHLSYSQYIFDTYLFFSFCLRLLSNSDSKGHGTAFFPPPTTGTTLLKLVTKRSLIILLNGTVTLSHCKTKIPKILKIKKLHVTSDKCHTVTLHRFRKSMHTVT